MNIYSYAFTPVYLWFVTFQNNCTFREREREKNKTSYPQKISAPQRFKNESIAKSSPTNSLFIFFQVIVNTQ